MNLQELDGKCLELDHLNTVIDPIGEQTSSILTQAWQPPDMLLAAPSTFTSSPHKSVAMLLGDAVVYEISFRASLSWANLSQRFCLA